MRYFAISTTIPDCAPYIIKSENSRWARDIIGRIQAEKQLPGFYYHPSSGKISPRRKGVVFNYANVVAIEEVDDDLVEKFEREPYQSSLR